MWQKHDNYAMKMTWVQEEKDDIYAFKKTFSELGCFALLASIDDLSLTLIRPRNIHLQNSTRYYLANILRDCLLNSGFGVYMFKNSEPTWGFEERRCKFQLQSLNSTYVEVNLWVQILCIIMIFLKNVGANAPTAPTLTTALYFVGTVPNISIFSPWIFAYNI